MAKDPWSDWNDDDPGNFQPGDKIGPYELLFPAAVGGMAAVWSARLRRPDGEWQIVAVKLLSDAMRGDDDARAMFLDEACTASRILHPNVVHILAYGEVRDRPYLAMEWIDGAPIAKLFSNQKAKRALLPLGWVLHVMVAACAGLHAAHEVRDDSGELLNLIHRDVTPENVMVTFDGMVKVVDFGVAKTRARAQVSRVGAIKGKTGYFSPEQVTGTTLDRRSDLFSLGVLLYLLVTGVPPFRGKGPLEAMQQIANRHPQPPREIMPDVHPELDRIILRALAKNPDERYQTAAELRRDLEGVIAIVGTTYTDKAVGGLVRDLLPGVADARKERLDQAIDELDRIVDERQNPHKPVVSRNEEATEVMLRRISMLPVLQGGEPLPEDLLPLPPLPDAGPASSRRAGPVSSRMAGPASSRATGPVSSRMAGPASSRATGPVSSRATEPVSPRTAGPSASSPDLAGLPGDPLAAYPNDATTNAGAALSEPMVRSAPARGGFLRLAVVALALTIGAAALLAVLRKTGRSAQDAVSAEPAASAPLPAGSAAEPDTGPLGAPDAAPAQGPAAPLATAVMEDAAAAMEDAAAAMEDAAVALPDAGLPDAAAPLPWQPDAGVRLVTPTPWPSDAGVPAAAAADAGARLVTPWPADAGVPWWRATPTAPAGGSARPAQPTFGGPRPVASSGPAPDLAPR